MKITEKFLNSTKQSYQCAKIKIEGNELVLINDFTGVYHKFITGDERINLSVSDKKIVREWLLKSI